MDRTPYRITLPATLGGAFWGAAALLGAAILLGEGEPEQGARPTAACAQCEAPSVGVALHHDVLPSLAASLPTSARRPSAPYEAREEEPDRSLPARLAGTSALPKGGVLDGVPAPALRRFLEALTDTGAPSDSTGDAGPRHYFQIANGGFTIWNKQGQRLLLSEYLPDLWQGFGGPCEQVAGDPYVLYDGLADRWLVAAMSFGSLETGPWLECVALSQTGDPLGGWNRWAWSFDRLNDFPKWGIWPDAYYMTFNGVPPPHAVIAFERSRMLAGDPAPRKIQFDVADEVWGVHNLLVPADLEGKRLPPAGAPNPVMGVRQAFQGGPPLGMEILEAHIDWAHPAASRLTTVATFPLALAVAFRRGPYHRLVYRNFGAFETLVTTTMVWHSGRPLPQAGGEQLDAEWHQYIRRPGGGWQSWRHGMFNPDDGWESNATAAMDGAGNIGVVWQKTNAAVDVPATERTTILQYSGREPGDPDGVLREPQTVVESETADPTGRFGDYDSVVVDPRNDCTFWLTGQYLSAGSTRPHVNVRIATFAFPNCPDTTAPDTRFDSTPATGAAAVQFTFSSTEPGSLFDCALDAKPFVPCSSPLRLTGLRRVRHTLRVRAIDAAGNVDASAAVWSWR